MPEAPQGTMMGASPQVEVQRTPQMMPGIIPPLQTASSGNTLAMTETVHPSGQMGIVTSGMENAPVKISTPISEEAQMRKDADIEERKAKIQAILDEKIGYTARKEMTFRQVWKDNRYMDFLLNKFIPTDSGTQAVKDKAIYLIANRKIVDMVI